MAGANIYFALSVATGATSSSGLFVGHHWDTLMLEIPSMTSGTDVYLKGSTDNVTYRRIYHAPTIANAAPGAVYFTSAVTNCLVAIPANHRPPYVKVELTTAATANSHEFRFIAGE